MLIKKLYQTALALLILALPLVSCIPASASNDPNFFAMGFEYKAYDELETLNGKIATVHIEADKQGMAGIEQDIRIKTTDGYAVIEIINWYYGLEEGVMLGLTVYTESGFVFDSKCPAQIGEIYSYELAIVEGVVEAEIRDSQDSLMFKGSYNCDAQYIESTASYIEYWRYGEPGSFLYYGYVTIENTDLLKHKDDFYHKSTLDVFDFYLIHRNWNGSYVDKGEIDDR